MNLGRPLDKDELAAVIDDGKNLDINISKISGCPYTSMDECEQNCMKYSGCWTIAYANDILVTYTDEEWHARNLNITELLASTIDA